MPFVDRQDAGNQLAKALEKFRSEKPIVLALPRGGVPVAAEVARSLNAPLDLLLVRKLGLPMQPELAMGAVVDGGEPLIVRNEEVIALGGVSDAVFANVLSVELEEIGRRRQRYLGDRTFPDLAGRTVIVIDDGIATGATMRAALQALRKRAPRWLVLAVPVAPADAIAAMREQADEVICLETHVVFGAIGYFYDEFPQVSDDEVIAHLQAAAQPTESKRTESNRSA